MPITQLALPGDSLTQRTNGASSELFTGKGNWAELVAERIANISGLGPLLTSGLRGTWLASDWVFTGAWSDIVSTDAWDKFPYNGSSGVPGKYANGAGFTARWTKPAGMRTMVGYNFYFIDYTNGGNFQLSEDGGAYFNISQTLAHDNKIVKVYIARPIASTLDVKAYDGAAGVGCMPLGVEAVYSTATSGLIVHNLGVNGAQLHQLVAATSGDRMAFLDAVKLGTGSPVPVGPFAAIVMGHINDVLLASSSGWGTNLATFYNRASPLGPVGFWSPWECLLATYDQTQQTNYRSQTATSAASLGAKLLDIYAAWSANGWTGNAAYTTAGLLEDGTHESQVGHLDLADRIYWWIRQQFFNIGVASNIFTVGRSQLASSDVLGGLGNLILGNRAAETDAANTGSKVVALPGTQSTESDTSNAGSPFVAIAGVRSAETDTANAGTSTIVIPGAQATETDTGSVGTPAAVVAGTQSAETDVANAGQPLALLPGGQSAETDAANSGSPLIARGGSVSTETDTATPGSPRIVFAGAQSTETDAANAGIPRIVITGAQALETDAAIAGHVQDSGGIIGIQAAETDTPFTGSPLVVVAGATALEVDLAVAGLGLLIIDGSQANELATALAGIPRVVITGGVGIELDTARAGLAIGPDNPDDVGDYLTGALASSWDASELSSSWQAGHIAK